LTTLPTCPVLYPRAADASPLGTVVLRIKHIPPRPASFYGSVIVLDAPAEAGEARVGGALGRHGKVVSCQREGRVWSAHFVEDAAAVTAAAAVDLAGLPGAKVALAYNERQYDERGW
jgi:hypothetical protein